MRKLWVLLKLNFRAMLRAFSFQSGAAKSKGKAAGGLGALALMAFLSLYLSSAYSFLLTRMLAEQGAAELALPLMAVLACVVSLMFTVMAASGLVFGGRDNDIMLTLPVSAFTVVLGKVLALYLENLVFCGLWMLPTGAAYIAYAGLSAGQAALFCARLTAALPFLPLLPSALALLGGWLIAYASGRMRHKAAVGTIVSMALLGAVLVGSMQINRTLEMLLRDLGGVRRVLYTWLLPFGLLTDALTGAGPALGLPALGRYILLGLAPFLALVWAVGTQYKRILSRLAGHTLRGDYKLRGVKTSGAFAALLRKECRRYFGTTIYVLNTGFGAVMLLGAAVYALAARGQALPVVETLGGVRAVMPMALIAICAIQSTVNPACVSVSMEGKTLWLLKEAPVPPRALFGAKALLSLLVSAVPAAGCIALLWAGYAPAPQDALGMLALCVCFAGFTSVFGLAVNLLLPRMDCDNDAIIVKQSAASMVGVFGGMLAAGLGVPLWLVCGDVLGFAGFCALAAAVLLLCAAALWCWVCTRGAHILQRL